MFYFITSSQLQLGLLVIPINIISEMDEIFMSGLENFRDFIMRSLVSPFYCNIP